MRQWTAKKNVAAPLRCLLFHRFNVLAAAAFRCGGGEVGAVRFERGALLSGKSPLGALDGLRLGMDGRGGTGGRVGKLDLWCRALDALLLLSMMGAWEDGLRGLGKGEKAGRAGRLDDDGRGGGRVSAVGCRRREEVYGFLHHDHGELGGGQGEGGGAKIMVVEGATRRQATSGRGARE